ncbi:MAG TPA: hypothetical protein VKR53_01895 [Puia sp.]|nr:hypothetical protein [Puia sp.]
MKRHYFFWTTCILFLVTGNTTAQLTHEDSAFYRSALSEAIDAYQQAIGDQAGIYNGTLYAGYSFQFRGDSPYFNGGKPDTGSIYYDSVLYAGVPLYYDDLSQLVIIDDDGYKIQLNNERLDEFSIGAHHFIQLGRKANNKDGLDPGFYELIYPGGIKVVKRTIKKSMDYISGNDSAEKLITRAERFYIEKDSVIHTAENENEVAAILSDKKKEILRFIKKNKLKFRKDTERTLMQVSIYYDQISQ